MSRCVRIGASQGFPENAMSKLARTCIPASLLAASLGIAGCHKDAAQDTSDPAAANLAMSTDTADQGVSGGAPQQGAPAPGISSPYTPTYAAPQRSNAQNSTYPATSSMPPEPPPDTASAPQASAPGAQYADEYAAPGDAQGYGADQQADYNNQADQSAAYEQPIYAPQPPPELPEYDQPECPGDNYEWTPGYWNYASAGYYWVPGVWVVAPFIGALWTPGWWGYGGDRYLFHHGYWGPHVGFYGGISYGYGYFGHGYEGGYWNRNQFFYNRDVTHINYNHVHNVYVHSVSISNNYNNRIAYNGGRGGINARPLPYELNAEHERHIAPLPQQMQHVEQARLNRAQFVTGNGRPQQLVASRPIQLRTATSPAGLLPAAPASTRALQTRTGGFEANRVLQPAAARPNSTPSNFEQQHAGLRNQTSASQAQANAPMRQPEQRPLSPQPQHSQIETAHPVFQQPQQRSAAAPAQPRPNYGQQVQQPARPAYQPQQQEQARPEYQAPQQAQRPAYQAPQRAPQQSPRPDFQQERPQAAPSRPQPQPARSQPAPQQPHNEGGGHPHR